MIEDMLGGDGEGRGEGGEEGRFAVRVEEV